MSAKLQKISQDPTIAGLDRWPVGHYGAALLSGSSVHFLGDVTREFPLASVTKPLVATSILISVLEGACSLDEVFSDHGATVRQGLAHASGIKDSDRALWINPNQQRIYSSRAYDIMADYLEQQTTLRFSDYFHESVCHPLSLRHTILDGSAGFGARSTVTDLTCFLQEYMLADSLVPSEMKKDALSVQFPGLAGFVPGYGKFPSNDWALGWECRGKKNPHWLGPRQPEQCVGHFGQAGGFLWYDPNKHIGAVYLSDQAFGGWAKTVWSSWNQAVYDALAQV